MDQLSTIHNIGIWLPWVATEGQHITSGKRFNQSPADNLQNCMTRCLRDPTGGKVCRAITISTPSDKTCDLRSKRVGDNGLDTEQTQSWQSFSRPSWYLGKLFYIILVQHKSAFNDS